MLYERRTQGVVYMYLVAPGGIMRYIVSSRGLYFFFKTVKISSPSCTVKACACFLCDEEGVILVCRGLSTPGYMSVPEH